MKPHTPPSKVNRLILEEASEWFVDFRVGDVDERSRERFDEWLRRSPEHIRAYMEIARTYVELPSAKLTGKIDVDSLIAYAHSGENVVPFNDAGNAQPNAPRAMSAETNHRSAPAKRPERPRRRAAEFSPPPRARLSSSSWAPPGGKLSAFLAIAPTSANDVLLRSLTDRPST